MFKGKTNNFEFKLVLNNNHQIWPKVPLIIIIQSGWNFEQERFHYQNLYAFISYCWSSAFGFTSNFSLASDLIVAQQVICWCGLWVHHNIQPVSITDETILSKHFMSNLIVKAQNLQEIKFGLIYKISKVIFRNIADSAFSLKKSKMTSN